MKRERTKIDGRWLAIPVVLVAWLMLGCVNVSLGNMRGNGNVVGQERSAQGFDSVVLAGVGDVHVHPGEEFRVVVTTDNNIQDLITTSVSGSTLHIGVQRNASFNATRLTIDVYLPALRNVRLQGVGIIIVGAGEAPSLGITLDGVGDISAQNFKAGNVNVDLSGVGDIRTWATDTLTGRISGVGDVLFRGDPTQSVDVRGVGRVRRL